MRNLMETQPDTFMRAFPHLAGSLGQLVLVGEHICNMLLYCCDFLRLATTSYYFMLLS